MFPVFLAAAFIGTSAVPPALPTLAENPIRLIECNEGQGSGFVVGKDIIATAAHVAESTGCYDVGSHRFVRPYYVDHQHDFALLTADISDTVVPIKYNCKRYKTNREYTSYGWTSYDTTKLTEHMRSAVAKKNYSTSDMVVSMPWGTVSLPGARHLDGGALPGMSGGPVMRNGIAYGLNNYGNMTIFGPTGENYSFELADTILCKR